MKELVQKALYATVYKQEHFYLGERWGVSPWYRILVTTKVLPAKVRSALDEVRVTLDWWSANL